MPPEVINEIMRIIKHGNACEVKKENGKIVVVQIERKVKIKTLITG